MGSFLMVATILSNAYMGNMLSHLLIPKQNDPINSLEELSTSPLTWILRDGTAEATLFMVGFLDHLIIFMLLSSDF